jgi:hypothetical protein
VTAALAALALALAAGEPAPGCAAALRDARAAAADPETFADSVLGIARRLKQDSEGRPTEAVERAAEEAVERVKQTSLPASREEAVRRFVAKLARHCALAAVPRTAGVTLDRDRLREILARPEFEKARTDTDFLTRLLITLWNLILDALGSRTAGKYASVGRGVFLAALTGLALFLAVVLLRRRVERAAPQAAGPSARARRAADPDAADRAAASALAAGDGREALRHAFLSALSALERARRLPEGRAETNRELTRRLEKSGGPLAGSFGTLAREFDAAIYGGMKVAAADAAAYLERARALRAELSRR